MHSQKILQTLQRHGLISLAIVLLSAFITIYGFVSTSAQSPTKQEGEDIKKVFDNTNQAREKKKEVFTEEDVKVEKVAGKWTLVSSLDMKQTRDYSVPVAVTYINTFYGQGKYAGRVKILEAKIENRSQKLTQSIQLRWSIVMHEEPDNILLEGLMPFMELRMEPFSAPPIVDIPPVYFNKIVKPLLKDNELSGSLRLIVGIQEVRFADGTAWQRTEQAAFLKTTFSSAPFDLSPQQFKPALFADLSHWRRPKP